jgi:hypothetical protein
MPGGGASAALFEGSIEVGAEATADVQAGQHVDWTTGPLARILMPA